MLLSAYNFKGTHPHLQSLALFTNAQSVWLRSPFFDTKMSFLNLIECFNLLYSEICLGCKLLDNFSDYVSFHLYDCSNRCTHKVYFNALDCLCHKTFFDLLTLVLLVTTSVISPRNIQVISVVYF